MQFNSVLGWHPLSVYRLPNRKFSCKNDFAWLRIFLGCQINQCAHLERTLLYENKRVFRVLISNASNSSFISDSSIIAANQMDEQTVLTQSSNCLTDSWDPWTIFHSKDCSGSSFKISKLILRLNRLACEKDKIVLR